MTIHLIYKYYGYKPWIYYYFSIKQIHRNSGNLSLHEKKALKYNCKIGSALSRFTLSINLVPITIQWHLWCCISLLKGIILLNDCILASHWVTQTLEKTTYRIHKKYPQRYMSQLVLNFVFSLAFCCSENTFSEDENSCNNLLLTNVRDCPKSFFQEI